MKTFKLFLKYSLLLFLLFIVSIVLINFWVIRSGHGKIFTLSKNVPTTPVALLLGTSRRVKSGGRNVFFFHRIDAAVELYKSGKVKKIIVSGDNGSEYYNETDDMREELIKRGVPGSAIVNDHAGFRTLDSVVRAKEVFGQEKIVVISQRFHIQRAIFIAKAHGIQATGFVAEDPAHRESYQRIMFREYFARVKAFLDCYILGTEPKFPGPPEPIQF